VTIFLCFTTHRALLHVHSHLFFMFHYTQLYFKYIVTSFLCFTTHSCTSCTKKGDNEHEVQLCVVKHKKEVTIYMKYSSVYWSMQKRWQCTWSTIMCSEFHYTQLYFMFVVTYLLCFTTHSCTLCTLSPLFYVSLHTAVLHVHCHLFFLFHGENVHEVQLFVEWNMKKEVKMYMKYSSV
jgi:hypothetical protein